MFENSTKPSATSLSEKSLATLLNSPQLDAVIHFPGPQLILAGAGSGKTRVLTYKIAWLMREKGLRPFEILAVTFTNKAAAEMRQRIAHLLGFAVRMPWMGTFHSVCAKLLRFHAPSIGYSAQFSIYDVDDQKKLVKKLLKDAGYEENPDYTVERLRHFISSCKNQGMTATQAKTVASDRFEEKMADLYGRYQKDLQANNGMDFDDLIFLAIQLLQSQPEIRSAFSRSFRYILVDEYQDTNKAQYQLIRLLLGPHNNLVVVGDDDQSIYGWRGADITNILSFQKDYANAHVTKLEQNYRSSANILGVANSIIRRNTARMDKTLWTQNAEGEKVQLIEQEDDIAEATFIAKKIKEDTVHRPGDIAVFYRLNSQSRLLEDEFRRQRVPYLIVGGTRYYERKEVKDLLAYLRHLCNPNDSVSLSRIINVPKRGIGEKTIQAFADYAVDHQIPLHEALNSARAPLGGKTPQSLPEGVSAGAAKKIADFAKLLDDLRLESLSVALPQLIEAVIERTGYKKYLEEDGSEDSFDRLANLEELISAAQDFLSRKVEKKEPDLLNDPEMGNALQMALAGETLDGSDLEVFLQEISLLSDLDTLKASQDAVTLMTVHSAKGLEFPKVFVTGLEDGLFPLLREGSEGNDLQEERRLMYVAVTRARQQLFLSYAKRRRRYGIYKEGFGSRFLQEMDASHVQNFKKAPKVWFSSGHDNKSGSPYGASASLETESFPDYENFSQEGEHFFKGQRVKHDKFGEGKIMHTEGHGDSAFVDVLFSQNSMRRKLMVKFAKLVILD